MSLILSLIFRDLFLVQKHSYPQFSFVRTLRKNIRQIIRTVIGDVALEMDWLITLSYVYKGHVIGDTCSPISAELQIKKKSIFGLPGERVQLLPGRRDRHGDFQPQGANLQDGIGQEPQLCGPWSDLAEIRTTRSVLRKICIRDIFGPFRPGSWPTGHFPPKIRIWG